MHDDDEEDTDEKETKKPVGWRKRFTDWVTYLFCFLVLCLMIAHMGDIGHGIEHRVVQVWDWVAHQVDVTNLLADPYNAPPTPVLPPPLPTQIDVGGAGGRLDCTPGYTQCFTHHDDRGLSWPN